MRSGPEAVIVPSAPVGTSTGFLFDWKTNEIVWSMPVISFWRLILHLDDFYRGPPSCSSPRQSLNTDLFLQTHTGCCNEPSRTPYPGIPSRSHRQALKVRINSLLEDQTDIYKTITYFLGQGRASTSSVCWPLVIFESIPQTLTLQRALYTDLMKAVIYTYLLKARTVAQ